MLSYIYNLRVIYTTYILPKLTLSNFLESANLVGVKCVVVVLAVIVLVVVVGRGGVAQMLHSLQCSCVVVVGVQ